MGFLCSRVALRGDWEAVNVTMGGGGAGTGPPKTEATTGTWDLQFICM